MTCVSCSPAFARTLVRIEQLRGRARGLLAVLAERHRSTERDRGQLMDSGVIATLEADAAQLRNELGTVSEQIAAVAAVDAEGTLAGDHVSTLEEARRATQKVGELTARGRGLNEDIDRLRNVVEADARNEGCLLYTSPSPRDRQKSRMPSSA